MRPRNALMWKLWWIFTLGAIAALCGTELVFVSLGALSLGVAACGMCGLYR